MKIKKISKMPLVALYVETDLKSPVRLSKKQISIKKLEVRGRAPQATLLKNIRRFATIAALQVGIGDVLVAFVIHIFVINIHKIQEFLHNKKD